MKHCMYISVLSFVINLINASEGVHTAAPAPIEHAVIALAVLTASQQERVVAAQGSPRLLNFQSSCNQKPFKKERKPSHFKDTTHLLARNSASFKPGR